MSKRITKTMAQAAVEKMKKAVYGAKIEEARAVLNKHGEELVKKYVPAPVIACVNEYSDYFGSNHGASIATKVTKPSGNITYEKYIAIKLSFNIPNHSAYINVQLDEYKELKALLDNVNAVVNEANTFEQNMFNALIALKTYKRIKEELPEALEYIDFPDECEMKAVPMPIFNDLRNIIKGIKKE